MEHIQPILTIIGFFVVFILAIILFVSSCEWAHEKYKTRYEDKKLKLIKRRLENFNGWKFHEHKKLLDDYVVDFYYSNKDLF
jgi:hypothetical protein